MIEKIDFILTVFEGLWWKEYLSGGIQQGRHASAASCTLCFLAVFDGHQRGGDRYGPGWVSSPAVAHRAERHSELEIWPEDLHQRHHQLAHNDAGRRPCWPPQRFKYCFSFIKQSILCNMLYLFGKMKYIYNECLYFRSNELFSRFSEIDLLEGAQEPLQCVAQRRGDCHERSQ